MIDFILGKIDENNTNDFIFDYLGPLKQINFFVGSNNSGKSRFLRKLITSRQLFAEFNDLSQTSQIEQNILILTQNITSAIVSNSDSGWSYKDYCNIRKDLAKFSNEGKLKRPNSVFNYIYFLYFLCKLKNMPEDITKNYADLGNSFLSPPKKNLTLEKEISTFALTALRDLQKDSYKIIRASYNFSYFPILRSLRTFKDKANDSLGDIFKERIIHDYFSNSSSIQPGFGSSYQNIDIHTGLSLYKDIQNLLLGNLADRKIVQDIQAFLSINFFEGQDVALIPKINDDVLSIKIGAEEEQPIHLLGDGLQTLITFIVPLFQTQEKKNKLFF